MRAEPRDDRHLLQLTSDRRDRLDAEKRAAAAETAAAAWETAWTELAALVDEFLAAREAKGTAAWYARYHATRAALYRALSRDEAPT